MSPMRPLGLRYGVQLALLVLASLFDHTCAFTPAQPSNASTAAASNTTAHGDTLDLFWFPAGSFNVSVNYQLAAASLSAKAIAEGPLVLFDEGSVNGSTTTPWIAFVSCDAKDNHTSTTDVFTVAWEQGAKAALLYSNTSQTCTINDAYQNQTEFTRRIPIFSINAAATTKLTFSQLTHALNTTYTQFDPTLLNDSASIIQSAVGNGIVSRAGFVYAILNGTVPSVTPPAARNATGLGSSSTNTTTSNVTSPTSAAEGSCRTKSLGLFSIVALSMTGATLLCTGVW